MQRSLLILLFATLDLFSANAEQFGDFTCTISSNNTVTIDDYTGAGGNVEIPSFIDGKSVTSIGDYAFRFSPSLTSITIPDSVTNMGSFIFASCAGLTNATIGNSITSLEEYAFAFNNNLTSLTLGSSVNSIGTYAFRDCEMLEILTIPDSVNIIEPYAFYSSGVKNDYMAIAGIRIFVFFSLTKKC